MIKEFEIGMILSERDISKTEEYAEFYLLLKEKNIEFQILTLESREDFVLWPVWGAPQAPVLDSQGNQLKFPVRAGSSVKATDEGHYEVESLKLMKKDEFKRLFPNLSKGKRHNREIGIGNQ